MPLITKSDKLKHFTQVKRDTRASGCDSSVSCALSSRYSAASVAVPSAPLSSSELKLCHRTAFSGIAVTRRGCLQLTSGTLLVIQGRVRKIGSGVPEDEAADDNKPLTDWGGIQTRSDWSGSDAGVEAPRGGGNRDESDGHDWEKHRGLGLDKEITAFVDELWMNAKEYFIFYPRQCFRGLGHFLSKALTENFWLVLIQ